MQKSFFNYVLLIISACLIIIACDSDDEPQPSCDGSLVVTISNVNNSECLTESGEITVSAAGGVGSYTFQLDAGDFQQGTSFTAVSAGTHQITVKDANNCTATVQAEVLTGSVLADIKPIIETNCAVNNCHDGSNTNLPNFNEDANIRSRAASIKSRTGDRSMPPASVGNELTDAEIRQIACWVDDGAN